MNSLVESFHRYIHPNYTPSIKKELLECLLNVSKTLSTLTVQIAPQDMRTSLRFLEQDPVDREGILLGMDPYPNGATGIPFEDLNFSKMSNKNLAKNVARIYEIADLHLSGFNLSNVSESSKLLLMNAAMTVPIPISGERSSSGQHYPIWQQFSKKVLSYILSRSPNCMFVLIFGKAAYLQELANEGIVAGHSSAYKIISYHPCMASFFLSEKSNPFQEINALLRLHGRNPIPWWRAISGLEHLEHLEEKRVIQDTGSFLFLKKNIEVCDLNNYECLLGDLEKHVIRQLSAKTAAIEELSKVYDRSLDMFKTSVKKLLSNVSEPIEIQASVFEDVVCGFTYFLDHVHIYLIGIDQNGFSHRAFNVPALCPVFSNKFNNRKVQGFFSLEVNPDDHIQLNSYEILIDIIFSNYIDYQLTELSTQLLTKIRPMRDVPPSIVSAGKPTEFPPKVIQTLSGFAYHPSKVSLKLVQPIMMPYITSDNHIVFIRNLNSKPIQSIRGAPVPKLSTYLCIFKDYHAAYAAAKHSKDTVEEIVRQTDISNHSIFHLGVAMRASMCPRRFQELCSIEYNEGKFSSTMNEKVQTNLREIQHLESILSEAKSKSSVNAKIHRLLEENEEFSIAADIINTINWIIDVSSSGANI